MKIYAENKNKLRQEDKMYGRRWVLCPLIE